MHHEKKKIENLYEIISLIIIGKIFAIGLRYTFDTFTLFKLRLEFPKSTKLRKFLFEKFQLGFY